MREHLARGPAGFDVGPLVNAHHQNSMSSDGAESSAMSASSHKSACSDLISARCGLRGLESACRPKGAGERRLRRREDEAAGGVVPAPAQALAPAPGPVFPALPYTRRPLARIFTGICAGGGCGGGNDACSPPAEKALSWGAVLVPPAEQAAAGPIDGAVRTDAPALKALRRSESQGYYRAQPPPGHGCGLGGGGGGCGLGRRRRCTPAIGERFVEAPSVASHCSAKFRKGSDYSCG